MSENRVVVRKNVRGWEVFEVTIRDYKAMRVFCMGCYWLHVKTAVEQLNVGEWKVRVVMGKREKMLTAQAAAFIERVVNLLESREILCNEVLMDQWSVYDFEHEFAFDDNSYMVSTYSATMLHGGKLLEDRTFLKSRIRILEKVVGRLEKF